MTSRFVSPWKYQFDETGAKTSNLITEEPHELNSSGHLPFPVNEGLFYTEGVVVTKQGDPTPLVVGTDYTFDGLDTWVHSLTGKENAAVINIVDKADTGTFLVTYQAVGGAEGQPIGMVSDLLDAINAATANPALDFRTDIINLPIAFPPEPHGHPLESMEQIDLLNQALRDVHNALINRIPMQHSANNLQQQIDRILGIIGSIRSSVNQVVAVQGSATEIQDLLDALDNIETVATAEVAATAGASTLIVEYDLTKVTAVKGFAAFQGATATEAMDFNVICRSDALPKITYSSRLITANAPVTEITATRVGTMLRISCTCQLAGTVKAKVLAAL
ncbi:hypothetical protein [Vibrio phage BONAISHI]|nr:hypothetical protein [Vibrio phage BONAISHI]